METVKSLEFFHSPHLNEVSAGMSVGITLETQIFVERGQVASHLKDAPKLTNIFRAKIFWLHDKPLEEGRKFKLKLATATYQVEVKKIEKVIDTTDLSHAENKKLERLGVGEVILRSRTLMSVDDFTTNQIMGRFVLLDGYDVGGGGIIDTTGFADQRKDTATKSENITNVDFKITRAERELNQGHRGGVMWFSGLSGSGKSTLANELMTRLFRKGYNVYVLDGDNVRHGLSSDLGFTHNDRAENLRRVAEVAALFADSGTIVITSFISPYKKERDQARAVNPDNFHSVYIKADLKTVETRDPKGLYKKARAGEIKNFTGVNDVFEEPDNADLTIDTQKTTLEDSLETLMKYVDENFVKPVRDAGGYEGSDI